MPNLALPIGASVGSIAILIFLIGFIRYYLVIYPRRAAQAKMLEAALAHPENKYGPGPPSPEHHTKQSYNMNHRPAPPSKGLDPMKIINIWNKAQSNATRIQNQMTNLNNPQNWQNPYQNS
jgi:hypothetical protein